MEDIKNKRIEWVDYIKAFACFLVALGHLLQSLQKSNIDNNMGITSYIIEFIYLFHMPLFMCVSGFLYCKGKRKISFESYKEFELKKIINLSVPYFTFYLLYLAINIIFSNSVNSPKGIEELFGVINNPMPPYWFLYALLSIFILIPIIEWILKKDKIVFVFLAILKIISIFWKSKIYFITSFMSYAIYFYFGIFINEQVKNKGNKVVLLNIILLALYIVVSLFYYNYKKHFTSIFVTTINIIFAITGILVFIECFKMCNKCRILDTFKKYTFQIYLTHTIFAAGIRIILIKLGITDYFIHFAFGITASIYMPVLMGMISDKIKYTNIFFFPIKTIKELKERKDKKCQSKS